jgi:flagellar assembly protein FliH
LAAATTTLSEAALLQPLTRLPAEAFVGAAGFRRDLRFSPVRTCVADPAEPTAEPVSERGSVADAPDPFATAFAEGYATGLADARADADGRIAADAAAREALSLALARIDLDHVEAFAARLRETVTALCEATLSPLALDPVALAARAARAAGLFAEADGDVTIRLHPEDIALVAPALGGGWTVAHDPALERGAIRVENAAGGVEDGPAEWRRAIEDVLGQC